MSSHAAPRPLAARRSGPLKGRLRVPGDKSISHRAFIFGLLSVGETQIEGLLEGDDVLRTGAACKALGAKIERTGEGRWRVQGAGLGSLLQPRETLDFGNAGTGSRLMMGVVGGHAITARFDGDASLRKRPMRRILDPLELMGARTLEQGEGGRCPILLQGAAEVEETFARVELSRLLPRFKRLSLHARYTWSRKKRFTAPSATRNSTSPKSP